MNLPTETDPFESPEDEKSLETPSPDPKEKTEDVVNLSELQNSTTAERQPTTTNTRQSWLDDDTSIFPTPAFLQDLKLPTHVKFPHKFRELYRKHSKKLPRSVRAYRTGASN